MATTRDRYILDVDTRSATRAVNELKRTLDSIGGSQTQQRMRQLQQSFNNIKVDKLNREVEQLKQKLDQLGKVNASRAVKELGNESNSTRLKVAALAGAAAGVVTAFAANIFSNFIAGARDAAIETDRIERSLSVFLGSSQRARQEMQRIGALANEMGVGIQDLNNAFSIFTRFGLDTSSESLRAWTNIAMASGKSMDQLGEAVADALTGEFERLKEFGIKVSQENGVFTASIAGQQDIVASSSQELINKLQALGAVGGAWAGGIEGNARTLEGSMNILNNSVREAQVAFMEGLKPALIEVNNQLAIFLNTHMADFRTLGETIGSIMLALSNNIDLVIASLQGLLYTMSLLTGVSIVNGFLNIILKTKELVGLVRTVFLTTGEVAAGTAALRTAIGALGGPISLAISAFAALEIALQYFTGEGVFSRAVSAIDEGITRITRSVQQLANTPDALINLDPARIADMAAQGVLTYDQALEELRRKLTELPGLMLPFMGGQGPLGFGFVFEEDQQALENLRGLIAEVERLKAEQEAAAQAASEQGAAADEQAAAILRATQANQAFMDSLESTPSVDFYNNLIRESQAALSETTIFQNSMEGLNEALRVGAISPDLYAESMRRLNEQMNQLDPDSYAAYFENLMQSAATGQREAEYLQRAIEDLQNSIVNGGTPEELERWRAALAQLTPDSFNAFYNSLIETAQGTVREASYTQQAIEALNESLVKGVISPEVYREAMARLNQELDSETVRTYQSVLAELNNTFAESQAQAAVNVDAMAALTEQFSNQIISLEQYRAGITALGGSFDEYLLSIGDINAYLQNLQSTVESSIRADETKAAAIRQLTAEYEAGMMAPELYAQMMQALGADIEFTAEQVNRLREDFNALTGTAEASLSAMEERVRAAQEQAELSGYEGVERSLRAITLEEERLRDATIERLRAQALANGVSQDVLNEQIARIEEQTRATIAARQAAARIEDDNRKRAEAARDAMRPTRTRSSRTKTPDNWFDRLFGGAQPNAGETTSFGPDGSKSNPLYVIPVFGGLDDILGNIGKSIINASDLTGNITGMLTSASQGLSNANKGGSWLGNLFSGFFATGGNIPAGRYGVVGEAGPEIVSGPATVTPVQGQQVVYNINAVDVRSFQDMLARDPGFVHAVVQRAQRRIPGGR